MEQVPEFWNDMRQGSLNGRVHLHHELDMMHRDRMARCGHADIAAGELDGEDFGAEKGILEPQIFIETQIDNVVKELGNDVRATVELEEGLVA